MDDKKAPQADQPKTTEQPSDAPAVESPEQPDPMQRAVDAIQALHRKLDSEQTLH